MAEQTLTKPKTIFLDPKYILTRVGLRLGQRVVDLGCGGGYFVLEAAREIGDDGISFGVDILQSALSAVASRARLYGLYNVRTVWSNAEVHGGAAQIIDQSIDLILMVQLLSQSQKHQEIFKEANRLAKQDGRIVIVDWRPEHGYRFGPLSKNCVTEAQVTSVASQHGWKSAERFEAGPYHYGLIFQR
jgi:ubiquinone/menaquinone biosynthesis C-methylase UbiE